MSKLEIRQNVAGLSREDIMTIGLTTAMLSQIGHDAASDLIVKTLDKYENEIIRLSGGNQSEVTE